MLEVFKMCCGKKTTHTRRKSRGVRKAKQNEVRDHIKAVEKAEQKKNNDSA